MLPVHNHSEYSALDGYSRPSEIADRIEELGLPGAFLTDHGTVAGLQTFTDHMKWRNPRKKEGKRDLFIGYGMEAYQARDKRTTTRHDNGAGAAYRKGEDAYHLILLAETPEGYKNLLRISDAAHRTGFYYDPRVDWELLERYREGLICTTACMGSLPCKALLEGDDERPLERLHKIFGDDHFFVELNTYDTATQRKLNQTLVEIANDRGIPLLYANDAHYAVPEDYDVHEALICAQYNEFLFAPKKHGNDPTDPNMHHPPCLYIMGEDEVREALSNLAPSAVDEAIANSDALMERCAFELEKPGLYLPKFKYDESEYESSEDMLASLVFEGLVDRFGDDDGKMPGEIVDRAEYEYESIVGAGLQDYFLIVWDYINYAMRQGVMVGPGRGSVGGSLMAYALGITSIDPLKHGLQFERFWNPGRADGLPDIDVDFEQSSRQFMIEYAKKKYGEDRVLPIGNHIFMRPKSAIDRAGAVLYKKPPYGAMESIKKIINKTVDAGQQPPWDEMMEMVGPELRGEIETDKDKKKPTDWIGAYPYLFELASLLAGRISTYGVHASAVVISSVPLEDRLPARMASDDDKRKVLVTQAEMKQVEKAGFPKFDFLGLKNLDTIMLAAIYSGEFGNEETLGPKFLTMREERERGSVERMDSELREVLIDIIDFYRNRINYDHLPDSFWNNFDEGHTLGLFQIDESHSPRRIAKELRPRNIEDLGFIVALNRPGPLRGGVVDRFLARRNELEDTTYPHPMLEEILEPTYGDFLYQEQVIAYFREIGYSLSDADHIRKILGKKLVEEMREELPRYLEYATQHMSQQAAEHIWHLIEEFSKYSFNKAHSIGYGTITAMTNYPKWQWPAANLMAAITINPKKIASWVNEATKLGIPVIGPDINLSRETISKSDDAVLFGIRDIKGIGADAAKWIIANGPYGSPEEFFSKTLDNELQPLKGGKRVKIVKANHRTALMDAGAFDGFGYRLAPCSECDGKGKVATQVLKKSGDGMKRALVPCFICNLLGYERVDLPDEKVKARLEEELLGIALTNANADLISAFADEIEACDPISSAEQDEETTVKVPGVIKTVEKREATWPTKPGDGTDWARVTIEWEGESVTFAAFPHEYKKYGFILQPSVLGEFTLKTSKKGPQLRKAYKYVA